MPPKIQPTFDPTRSYAPAQVGTFDPTATYDSRTPTAPKTDFPAPPDTPAFNVGKPNPSSIQNPDYLPGGVFAPAGSAEKATGAGMTNAEQAKMALKNTGDAVSAVAPVMTFGASLPIQSGVGAAAGALGTKSEGGTNLQAIRNAALGAAIPPAIEYGGQGLGKIVSAAKNMFGGGTENPTNVLDLKPGSLAEGAPKSAIENPVARARYSEPGNLYSGSMKSNSRFDMPAEASRAIPALREAAADLKVNPEGDFQGMNGPTLVKRITEHALEINEARNAAAIDFVRTQPADVSASPELSELMGKKNPIIQDVDQFRLEGNKKLAKSGYYGQSPSQQYAAGPDLAKLETAVSQARDVVYDSVYKNTGVDIRPSKQVEASLIKLNDVANSTNNTLAQQEAKYQSTPVSQRILGSIKRLVSVKANPTNAFEPGINSPTDEFNTNMKRVFTGVNENPTPVMANRRLLAPGKSVLVPPPGTTPPPVSTQGQLPLEPNKPGFQLTPPAGTTPPAIQPHQGALPLTSSYAPMGENAGLTSNIPGEAVPGANLNITGGNGINTPMQNILDFSKEAHPTEVPGPLRGAAGLAERRAAIRPGNLSAEDIAAGMRGRKPLVPSIFTPKDMETINADVDMPKAPGAESQGGGHAGGGVISAEELARPGVNYVVPKEGPPTYHGKSFDPGSTPKGAAHVTVLPNGELRVNEGTLSPLMETRLRNALRK